MALKPFSVVDVDIAATISSLAARCRRKHVAIKFVAVHLIMLSILSSAVATGPVLRDCHCDGSLADE